MNSEVTQPFLYHLEDCISFALHYICPSALDVRQCESIGHVDIVTVYHGSFICEHYAKLPSKLTVS